MIGQLPPGTKGFDCDWPVDSGTARTMYARKHRFVVRYVGRVQRKDRDVSSLELGRLLRNGLAVMLVQHVKSAESWEPTGDLGHVYGKNAAHFAEDAGYQHGAVLWCDLEGVALGTPRANVIAYCNNWHDEVRAAGYEPGLYVGWRAGLNASDLYYRLRFARYWSAFNLNRDQFPAIRGVQLRQHVASANDVPPGMRPTEIDVNLIGLDAFGSSPVLMLATGDR